MRASAASELRARMDSPRPPAPRRTAETVAMYAYIVGGVGLVAAADLVAIPALGWLGLVLVVAGGVATAVTGR